MNTPKRNRNFSKSGVTPEAKKFEMDTSITKKAKTLTTLKIYESREAWNSITKEGWEKVYLAYQKQFAKHLMEGCSIAGAQHFGFDEAGYGYLKVDPENVDTFKRLIEGVRVGKKVFRAWEPAEKPKAPSIEFKIRKEWAFEKDVGKVVSVILQQNKFDGAFDIANENADEFGNRWVRISPSPELTQEFRAHMDRGHLKIWAGAETTKFNAENF